MDELTLIARLKTLEASWASLDAWLRFWIFLVVLGVVVELIVILVEYFDELHEFRRGILKPPGRPSTWLLVFGLLGAGLVAIGVAGEFGIQIKAGKVETEMRDVTFNLVAIADGKAGEANDRASANEIVAQQLKAENLKLETVIQPRTINESDRQKIADKLRRFAPSLKGRKVSIASQIGDGETMLVALEMADILRRSGIEFDPSGMGRTSWVGMVFMGVGITGTPSDREFVSEFVGDLFVPLDKGIIGAVKPEYKELRINVGVKPIIGLPKEWLRQTPP